MRYIGSIITTSNIINYTNAIFQNMDCLEEDTQDNNLTDVTPYLHTNTSVLMQKD